jgi:hypothetical protein
MRTPLLLSLLLLGLTARSQQPGPKAAAREQLFIANARALPRLYDKKDFDSIQYYIQLRWQPGPVDPDLLCQSFLLSIQRHIFYLTDFPDLNSLTPEVIDELRIYSDVLAQIQRNCPPDYHARSGYDVADIDRQLFFTTSRWAHDLLNTRDLDSVEDFLCRVYTGQIRYPDEYLSDHTALPNQNSILSPRPFPPRKLGAVLAVSSGIWAPEGHLSLLGIHPSINYTLGIRNRRNEWDFDAALRFGNTLSPYIILRNDSLFSRTYYDGGNAGFDYTRYLIHHAHSEIGLSGGVGLDFIDVASSTQNPDWSPTEITCFDLNFGFRYNWYFAKHGFVGLVARYHFLNYNNPGGSSFDGNAATIDIIVGLAGEYRH